MDAASEKDIAHDRAYPGSRTTGLASTVRARRRELGLQQRDLADLAGCSTRFVYMLESGKESVRLDKVLDVLGVLGLDLATTPGSGLTVAHDDEGPR